MGLASDIKNISYRRDGSTGNLVASFEGVAISLVANRSGLDHGHSNITSYCAMVDGIEVGAGTLSDAKLFAGFRLLDLFAEKVEVPDCSPAGEPC